MILVCNLQFVQMLNNTQQDELKWVQETLDICPSVIPDMWDELYEAVRNNREFPVKLEQAVEIMRIISEVKSRTCF